MEFMALLRTGAYLTKRQRYVTLETKLSEQRLVDCGVPQSSILYPLLFLISINDFPNCSVFLVCLMIDNSTLFCRCTSVTTTSMSTILSSEPLNIFNSISVNEIKVNTEKCNLIHFSFKQDLMLLLTKLKSIYIDQTDRITFLGLVIDKNLNIRLC